MKRIKLFVFFVSSFSFFLHCSAQIISTIAGNGVSGYSGNGGPATAAEIIPQGLTVDIFGNVYISDYDSCVRRINASGVINTFAGIGVWGYSGSGGPAILAELSAPSGLATDDSGNVYIADMSNYVIRKVNTSGIISTFAGNGYHYIGGGGGYSGDGGAATDAELNNPSDVATDESGNIYIVDTWNEVIRKVNTSGIISTIAGNGYRTGGMGHGGDFSGDGGTATDAELDVPEGVAVDHSGNVYIADYDNLRIRMVNTLGIITTFAGKSADGYTGDGGPATDAELNQPTAVKVNDSCVYITGGTTIRKVNTSGLISTFAGNDVNGFSGDGGEATAAEISYIIGMALDNSGNLYFGDIWNYRVRKVWMVLDVSTILTSNINCYSSNNGSATAIASEGTNPYTYSWFPTGGTNSTTAGLSAGTYTVFVTDSNNIKGSATITITQPIAINITADSLADYGSCNGSAWVVVNGGTAPYSYFWSGGLTTDTIQNQCLGTYCATIIDAHGCIDSICTTIESATGINDVSNSQSTNIYPDPNSGKCILSLSNVNEKCNIEVYNTLGEKVYSQLTIDNSQLTIDLSSQPDGVYLYRVLSENGSLVGQGKIVLEK